MENQDLLATRATAAEEPAEDLRNGDRGFTLIELMVVVLIIAILIAIAIPTFLGARERSQDRAVQSNLRNGLTAAKVIYADSEDYTEATTTHLEEIEPSLDFVTGAESTARDIISVSSGSTQAIEMVGLSASGSCWGLVDLTTGEFAGTYYGETTPCRATDDASNANLVYDSWSNSPSPSTVICFDPPMIAVVPGFLLQGADLAGIFDPCVPPEVL